MLFKQTNLCNEHEHLCKASFFFLFTFFRFFFFLCILLHISNLISRKASKNLDSWTLFKERCIKK